MKRYWKKYWRNKKKFNRFKKKFKKTLKSKRKEENSELTKSQVDQSNRQLWNKYRHKLLIELSKRYCSGNSYNCPKLKKTGAQMITEPMGATWYDDITKLGNTIGKYAPKWAPNYSIKTMGVDGEISELYKKFLLAIPDKSISIKKYVNFMKAKPKQTKNSYSWIEVGETLKQFKKRNEQKKGINFSFSVDKDTKTSISNSWSDLGSWYQSHKGFMREIKNKKKLSDDLENFFDEKTKTNSDSQFLFRGRSRTVTHKKYIEKTVLIPNNKFEMKFSAKELKGIRIKPNSNWFDYEFLKKNRETLKKLGYLGKNGKFSLLPHVVYVAYEPRVEFTIGKSQYKKMEDDIKSGKVYGYLVGGFKFKAPSVKSLSDNEITFFKDSEKASIESDQIFAKPINQYKDLELDHDDNDDAELHEHFDQFTKETIEGHHQTSDSAFLRRMFRRVGRVFRRVGRSIGRAVRRVGRSIGRVGRSIGGVFYRKGKIKHETVVITKVRKVDEGELLVTFVSKDPIPQIVAIVSDRL